MDDGHAIHYTAVERGTPVFDSEGAEVGRVHKVLDNHREHILDGIVIEAKGGKQRFVDGPEVARTAERGVTLAITAAEVARLDPPEQTVDRLRQEVRSGPLGRLFRSRSR